MFSKQTENYNHKQVEAKWQRQWQDDETFKFDINSKKPKNYTLSMFPYPSGELHVGHLRNFAIGDVVARYKRLRGFNVLHPTGADALGLPAENAAIKNGLHPSEWTYGNLERFLKGMKSVGLSFDFSRTVATCDPKYYGWQQKIFIEFYKKGLAYQKESFVNWDPVDQTVLANEQVINGRGWRSDALVEKKKLKQWFFRITNYAEELLNGLKNLKGWTDKVKLMQENWIGKSEGALVDFDIIGGEKLTVYTTRPDTLFGASFIGISPDHPIAEKLAKTDNAIAQFLEECKQTAINEETIETMEKKGIISGLKVKHPFDENWELPVYVANFILTDYGTGVIFGCPAHDKRDFEFAKKYGLSIKAVVVSSEKDTNLELPFIEEGIVINSKFLDGLTTKEAKKRVIKELEKLDKGKKKVNYRIRDWGISRQRYWGCPIPMVYCSKCGMIPVKDSDLPVKLPDDVVFDGKGNPLANHPTWKHTKCPVCGGKAERETDTMDTFVDSSWYFLRCVNLVDDAPFDVEMCKKVMPIDQYVGGIEHATMHLIYCRFFVKALRDCEYLNIDEPAINLFNQGMVCHKAYRNKKEWFYPWDVKEENGKYFSVKTKEELSCVGIVKMSKSKKNVVDITDIVNTYGADSARLFVLSDSPADKDFEWSEKGIEGCWKYLNRVWKLTIGFIEDNNANLKKLNSCDLKNSNHKNLKEIHKVIRDITNFLNKLEFNKAIARIRELSNSLEDFKPSNEEEKSIMFFGIKTLVKLIAPFTPHLSEELNELLGEKIKLHIAKWPEYDEKMTIDNIVTIAIQVNGKLRGTIEIEKNFAKDKVENMAKKEMHVVKHIEGKEIKKIIIVPNKLVNIVI
jgi:leucyl-tRNA synthetase